MDSHRLGHLARRQTGLFTRAQARACGFTAAHVARRLRDGAWRALDDEVLMLPSVTVTPALRDLAAQLTVRGSVLAGLSAARRWGIEVPPAGPHLIVDRRVRPVAGVRIEHASLSARDRTRVDGVATTTRDRTIFDCLRLLPVDNATRLLDRALQQDWVRLADITGRLGAATGRRGVEQVCQLVRAAGDGSRSTAERRMTRLLRQAGLTGWVANAAIHDRHGLIGIGDVVFAATRLVLEIDGRAFHCTPDRFQHDRTRQNRLVTAGWTVLRFTWYDLAERPDHVIRTIRAALACS